MKSKSDDHFNSDENLAKGIKNGNQLAFTQVFEKYYYSLCTFVNTYTRDQDQSREIVQTIFIRLWDKKKSLEIYESLRAYLYRAAYNETINYIKKEKKRREKEADAASGQKFEGFQIEEDLDLKELESKLEYALQKMPERRYTIFVLNRRDGLTYPEIAEALSISQKTVEYHMGHALRYLKEVIK